MGVFCVPVPSSGSVADRRIPQMEDGEKTNMGDLNRKEEAIRWLTQELRSLRLAPDINGCDMQHHWQEQIDILETCLEAVRACHIGDTSKMVPLTQADIETMHFERVWIDYGEDREEGIVLYGRLYSIDTLDGAGFEGLLLDATGHGGENIESSSGAYTLYRRPPERKRP